MLKRRQLIPPLTLADAHGGAIRAWDFKQSKNLVIVFLDAHCAGCERFVADLTKHAAELADQEAVVFLAFPQEPSVSFTASLPPGFIAGLDLGGHGAQAFLGDDALPTQEGWKCAVFVTDRYGELSAEWAVRGHQFPAIGEILRALNSVEIACEECSVPDWPIDE